MKALALVALLLCACQSSATQLTLAITRDVDLGGATPLESLTVTIAEGSSTVKSLSLPLDGSTPVLPATAVIGLPDADESVVVTVTAVDTDNRRFFGTDTEVCRAHQVCVSRVTLEPVGFVSGHPCAFGTDCASGFCAGQVCCSTECTGACETCLASAGAPADGQCGPLVMGTICKPSAGVCDPADTCDGTSPDCAASLSPAGTVCRPSVGMCDAAETCDGMNTACPPDVTTCPSGQYCADAGTNGMCQPLLVNGSGCDDDGMCAMGHCEAGLCCDTACTSGCDTCGGIGADHAGAGTCQHIPASAMTVCRKSTGMCDPSEYCDGNGACPADTGGPVYTTSLLPQSGGIGMIETGAGGSPVLTTTALRLECVAGQSPPASRTYFSYATNTVGATMILTARFVDCVIGSLALPVQVSSTNAFALPLTAADYSVPISGTSRTLTAVGGTSQAESTALSPTQISLTASTQLTVRLSDPSCPTGTTSSKQFYIGSNATVPGCMAALVSSGPQLALTYCK